MIPTAHPHSFSWGRLIIDMKLQGLSALIACYTEPISYDASIPALGLEINEHLAELGNSPAMDRLKNGLIEYFGEELQLSVTYGPARKSPAAQAQAERIRRFADAYSSIAKDDVVAQMIAQFGAKVVVETVQPTRKHAPKG